MKNLSVWLPPFAGDYSGAAAVFYGMNALTVLLDASCCTRNYVEYDEPRWGQGEEAVFSAQLRTVEVALGDDRRLIARIREAAETLRPSLIAVLGTPISAVTGADLKSIALRLEKSLGIPCIGLETTGFHTYEVGVDLAMTALLDRFAEPGEKSSRGINLLGLTPMDFGTGESLASLRDAFGAAGMEIVCSMAMGGALDAVKMAGHAGLNVVLSAAALGTARAMRQRFGIPFVAGLPMGKEGTSQLISMCDETLQDGKDRFMNGPATGKVEDTILFLGDQVWGNALRCAMRLQGRQERLYVSSFFAWEESAAHPGDVHLRDEQALQALLRNYPDAAVCCDPLFRLLPEMEKHRLIPFTHPAVSGTCGMAPVSDYTKMDATGI